MHHQVTCMALISQLRLVTLLVAAAAVSSSEAQAGQQTTQPQAKFSLGQVDVALYCTPKGKISPLGLNSPPFPYAKVQMQCGNGELLANATTEVFGITFLATKPMPALLFLQNNNECKRIVDTTLFTCHSRMPSTGRLESPLTFTKNIFRGNTKISTFKPTGFKNTDNPSISPVNKSPGHALVRH